MLGTAFPAARLLLVELPGPWGRQALQESRLDPDIAAELQRRANAAGLRVQTIRRPGRTDNAAPAERAWALVDTRDGREGIEWGSVTHQSELLDIDLDAPVAGRAPDGPTYLVCTHGKHDPCCALRGRPVASALDVLRPDRVWECSHLGGDRFAANVLVLPSGLLYGQVLPVAAAEFVAAAEADEVVPGLLRGQVGLPPVGQAALAFAYEHLALRQRSAVRLLTVSEVHDAQATARLQGPHGVLEVAVAVERVKATGLTCANPRPNEFLRYRPTSIRPVLD